MMAENMQAKTKSKHHYEELIKTHPLGTYWKDKSGMYYFVNSIECVANHRDEHDIWLKSERLTLTETQAENQDGILFFDNDLEKISIGDYKDVRRQIEERYYAQNAKITNSINQNIWDNVFDRPVSAIEAIDSLKQYPVQYFLYKNDGLSTHSFKNGWFRTYKLKAVDDEKMQVNINHFVTDRKHTIEYTKYSSMVDKEERIWDIKGAYSPFEYHCSFHVGVYLITEEQYLKLTSIL